MAEAQKIVWNDSWDFEFAYTHKAMEMVSYG